MMEREEFLTILGRSRTDEVVVTTMGAVRTWGWLSARPELDFVSADSAMGHTADLALGLALARPERQILCLNGDGSMLMSLGTLATISEAELANLILVVLQNGVYEITGNQAVPAIGKLQLAAMARAAGIPHTFEWHRAEQVEADIEALIHLTGPRFAQAHIRPGKEGPIRRGPDVTEPFLRDSIAESAHQLRQTLGITPKSQLPTHK